MLLAANYAMLWALTVVGVPTMVAKVLTEVSLFCISFVVQRLVVFAQHHARPARLSLVATPTPESDVVAAARAA